MTLSDDLSDLFGAFDRDALSLSAAQRERLLQRCWREQLPNPASRALLWRVLLGLLSPSDRSLWCAQLSETTRRYAALKERTMPSIAAAKADPLSALLLESEIVSNNNTSNKNNNTTSKASNNNNTGNSSSTASNHNDNNNNNKSSGSDTDAHAERGSSWQSFYKHVELTDFIKGDLDRLYLQGIEDDFFQTPRRRESVLTMLFLWAAQHEDISYRQGMHEIAGAVLFVVEQEAEAWERELSEDNNENKSLTPQLRALGEMLRESVSVRTVGPAGVRSAEAFAYAIFERVMLELACLYDPLHVYDGQPFVVQFCSKIQEHYLRMLDPRLCEHLEQCFVPSQLYGLRWSRLLLGREFSLTHTHALRLWDFMFACCFHAEACLRVASDEERGRDAEREREKREEHKTLLAMCCVEESPVSLLSSSTQTQPTSTPRTPSLPNVYSLSAHALMNKNDKFANAAQRRRFTLSHADTHAHTPLTHSHTNKHTHKQPTDKDKEHVRVQYVVTPLLGALGDVMLGMLLLARDMLLGCDSHSVIAVVMRFPLREKEHVGQLVQCADLIRRGLLLRDINANGSVLNESPIESHQNAYSGIPQTPTQQPRFPLVENVKDKLQMLKSLGPLLGSGISEIQQRIAPLLDPGRNDDVQPNKVTDTQDADNSQNNPSNSSNNANNGGRVSAVARALQPPHNPLSVRRRGSATQHSLTSTAVQDDPLSASLAVPESVPVSVPVREELAVSESSTAAPSECSHTSLSSAEAEKEVFEEVDPLTGLPLSSLSVVSQSHKQRETKPLRGNGTSYAPISPSRPQPQALSQSHSQSAQAQKASLFSPTWFSSSAKREKQRDKQKDRLSVGVDLRALSHTQNTTLTQSDALVHTLTQSSVSSSQSQQSRHHSHAHHTAHAQNEAVRDRLLEIADHLLQLSQSLSLTETQTPTQRESSLSVSSMPESPLSPELPVADDVCAATARRLSALASVLCGDARIVDYDARFAHKHFSSRLPGSSSASGSESESITSTHTLTTTVLSSVTQQIAPTQSTIDHEDGEAARLSVAEEDNVHEKLEEDLEADSPEMEDMKSVSSADNNDEDLCERDVLC